MILNKIEDPRDNLEKARRWELVQFAEANGVAEVNADMPAILMRKILRSRGLTQIPIPGRPLGNMNQPHPRPMYKNGLINGQSQRQQQPDQPQVVEADSTDDLARQFRAEQSRPPRLVPKPQSAINALRDECKRAGIKLARTDRMPDMRAKLEAHRGQNAPE